MYPVNSSFAQSLSVHFGGCGWGCRLNFTLLSLFPAVWANALSGWHMIHEFRYNVAVTSLNCPGSAKHELQDDYDEVCNEQGHCDSSRSKCGHSVSKRTQEQLGEVSKQDWTVRTTTNKANSIEKFSNFLFDAASHLSELICVLFISESI